MTSSNWREQAACRAFPEMFFTRTLRYEALHICRYHCPVAMSCHAESKDLNNVGVVIGGRAYGENGEALVKTEGTGEVRVHNQYCRALTADGPAGARKQQKEAGA